MSADPIRRYLAVVRNGGTPDRATLEAVARHLEAETRGRGRPALETLSNADLWFHEGQPLTVAAAVAMHVDPRGAACRVAECFDMDVRKIRRWHRAFGHLFAPGRTHQSGSDPARMAEVLLMAVAARHAHDRLAAFYEGRTYTPPITHARR